MNPVGLSCRVTNTWEDVRAISGEWDALAKRVGASIFLSPTYAEIWWKYYGRGILLIVECRFDGRLVGVVPMFVSTLVAGIFPVRVAKLLTSDSTIAVLTPPIEAEHAQSCWVAVIKSSLAAGAEVICLSQLSGEDGYAEEAQAAIAASGLRPVANRALGPHTVFNLPNSIDAYYSTLGPQSRANLRRARRQVEKMGNFEIRFATSVDARKYFERFIELHTARWVADGLPGHFGDWPKSEAFNTELVSAHADRGEVFLIEVCVDGRVVCAIFGFIYGPRIFIRLNGRLTDGEWNKARLGNVIQAVLIEQVFLREVFRLEDGPAHYPNKIEAGGTEFPLMQLVACRRDIVSTVKAFALVAWSKLWHYGYYRGWRARLLPALGIRPGPLLGLWIRTRL
jgi:CelD/BcsL family acetyltransferase involved in cellulose biosynthesis